MTIYCLSGSMYIGSLVLRGVMSVLTDSGFNLPTPYAITARSVAPAVTSWCEDPQNQGTFHLFAENLVTDLTTCLTKLPASKPHIQREYVWNQYHSMLVSALSGRSGQSLS